MQQQRLRVSRLASGVRDTDLLDMQIDIGASRSRSNPLCITAELRSPRPSRLGASSLEQSAMAHKRKMPGIRRAHTSGDMNTDTAMQTPPE
jgi:hypothetical protein